MTQRSVSTLFVCVAVALTACKGGETPAGPAATAGSKPASAAPAAAQAIQIDEIGRAHV